MEQDTASEAANPAGGLLGVPMPAFLAPRVPLGRPRREDPAPDSETAETAGPAEEIEHQWADAGASASAVDAIAETAGPSPASTDKALRPLATKAQVEAAKRLVGSILMAAGGLMNRRVALHDADRRWIMAPGDRDAIAAPLARILARHSPVSVDGESASDLADGIEAVVGIIAYSIEQLQADPGPAPALAAVADPNTGVYDANPFAPTYPAA